MTCRHWAIENRQALCPRCHLPGGRPADPHREPAKRPRGHPQPRHRRIPQKGPCQHRARPPLLRPRRSAHPRPLRIRLKPGSRNVTSHNTNSPGRVGCPERKIRVPACQFSHAVSQIITRPGAPARGGGSPETAQPSHGPRVRHQRQTACGLREHRATGSTLPESVCSRPAEWIHLSPEAFRGEAHKAPQSVQAEAGPRACEPQPNVEQRP
jgi:hypothetical protein